MENREINSVDRTFDFRQDFINTSNTVVISAEGTLFKIGDTVCHEGSEIEGETAIIESFSTSVEDITATTSKGKARISFLYFPDLLTEEKVIPFKSLKDYFGPYWEYVKDIVTKDGWVYTRETAHMLDSYYESNTKNEIEFQKSSGPSGVNPDWGTRGSRWRPKAISDFYNAK